MLETQSRIQTKGHWIVFGTVIILGLSTAFYLYSLDKYSLVYFGDSASHMLIARKIVDWMDPGLQQIGTVWLPLPHFMLLPFTLIDSLFTTGFAGLMVSLPCLSITAALLYKMAKMHLTAGFGYVAFVATMLYVANPNVLYLGLTAMTEAPFMLFFVAAAYFMQKWYRNSEQLHTLALSSIFVALATVCRYEGWILPLFIMPFVIVLVFKNKVDSRNKIFAILLSSISFAGIIFWLAYNQYEYGNSLEFAKAQYYSASSQALSREYREVLFLQPANVMSVYGATVLVIFGPILLFVALAGYIAGRKVKEGGKDRRMMYIFLVLPPIFTIVTLLIGVGEMTFWFNSRFVILLAPLIVMLAAVVFLQNLPGGMKKNRNLIAAVVGALFIFQISTAAFGWVPTYLDAQGGFYYQASPFAAQAGEALGSMYDDGIIMIVTGSAQEHRIMTAGGIPLKEYDEILESSMWKQSFHEPWSRNKWMVIGKEPDLDGVSPVKYWQDRHNELDEHYKKTYENEYYEILVLK